MSSSHFPGAEPPSEQNHQSPLNSKERTREQPAVPKLSETFNAWCMDTNPGLDLQDTQRDTSYHWVYSL